LSCCAFGKCAATFLSHGGPLSKRMGHARPPAAAQFVERCGHARMNGISLRLARWGRIYVLRRRVRKQK
jgi:hypothetical protein